MDNKNLYGVVAVLLVGLIISSSAGAYYYYRDGQEAQDSNYYATEAAGATAQYNQLVSQYNSALSLYNQTLSLLAGTTGALNTSLPIYAQASAQLPGLWNSYLKLRPQSAHVYAADVLIDFGNGTSHWYNNTQVQPGWNLYTTTVVLTNGSLQSTYYPNVGGGEHFVTGMDGVANTNSEYWFVWTYNRTASWQTAQVGADDLPVFNGSVFAWTFCGSTPSFAPTCKP